MRILHPVTVHETFIASGMYRCYKDGEELRRTESWSIHEHPDGERFIRVDDDSRFDESDGKSILLEALLNKDGQFARFDIHYTNPKFENGIRSLMATYSLQDGQLQAGRTVNNGEREYTEIDLPPETIIDLPFSIFRGSTATSIVWGEASSALFVPLFEQLQLFPGVLTPELPAVEFVGDKMLTVGKRTVQTRHYTYSGKSLSYWVDTHGIMIKRKNIYKQQNFSVLLTNYAHR